MKLYQIGKFASKLGVTHDLLKHYEKCGIIKSVRQGEGGYRYYPYTEVPNILFCREFQNWGFSLREISFLIKNAGPSEFCRSFSSHIETMEKKQDFQTRCLAIAKERLRYAEQIANQTFAGTWSIEERDEFLYLSHSSGSDFELVDIEPEALAAWTNHLPVTSMASRIYRQGPDTGYDRMSHGFRIREADARQFDIPCPKEMIRIPRQKYFIYQSELPTGNRSLREVIDAVLREPFALMEKHCFTALGDIYSQTLFQTRKEGVGTVYRMLYIPLEM